MSEQEPLSAPVAPLEGLSPSLATDPAAKSPHAPQLAVIVGARDRRGLLHDLAAAILRHDGLIVSLTVQVHAGQSTVSLEMDTVVDPDGLLLELEQVAHVETVTSSPSMFDVYGKRVIVVGAGAQVGQVAVGAIGEADRHNIRGEKISVDTIPVVGEDALARAVRAVARLPRVSALVLAGSLMGGTIADAVDEVRAAGVLVIALNMVGSVPAHADLVVTDPLQAGVMSVMAVASTARFDIARVRGRRL